MEDDGIDPAEQVFRHDLPDGSDVQALFDRVCTLHAKRLDRCRPLWEMHVFDGLAGGRIGLYFKTHHGLIDGIGFINVIQDIVTRTPSTRSPQAFWRGLPQARTRRTVARQPAPGLLQTGLAAGRTAGDLVKLMWHLGRRDLGIGKGMATPFVATPDVLKAPLRRTASWRIARCPSRGCVPSRSAATRRSTTCCWPRSTSR